METTQTVPHKGYALVNYAPLTQWNVHEYKIVSIITSYSLSILSHGKSLSVRSAHVLLS